jgi:hypothetical protein
MSVDAAPRVDPFNFPMANRCDGMSMSVIDNKRDMMKTHKTKFATSRISTVNNTTHDIEGKQKYFMNLS